MPEQPGTNCDHNYLGTKKEIKLVYWCPFSQNFKSTFFRSMRGITWCGGLYLQCWHMTRSGWQFQDHRSHWWECMVLLSSAKGSRWVLHREWTPPGEGKSPEDSQTPITPLSSSVWKLTGHRAEMSAKQTINQGDLEKSQLLLSTERLAGCSQQAHHITIFSSAALKVSLYTLFLCI